MLIYKYILKNHIAPFFFSAFILFAVLLLQYLMKIADRLIGKGLSFWVISKFIVYSLAWMLVLVIPMSVLVATMMAFGSMAQNNEIAIFKASGMSLYKMIITPLLASFVIAILLVQFNNHVYPNTNHAARILLQNISRQKPTLSLVPGVFSKDVQNYSILVKKIDKKTDKLKDVIIYDNSDPSVLETVTAKEGKIYFSKNHTKLIMDLHNGEIHESSIRNNDEYRRLIFKHYQIAMNAEQFSYQQSSFGNRRGERELGAQDMLVIVDSLERIKNNYLLSLNRKLENKFFVKNNNQSVIDGERRENLKLLFLRVKERAKRTEASLLASTQALENNLRDQNKYWVEIHKKYSLPVACIIFVLIGAPLGTMMRRGGFGVAAGFSLIFFLIYWFFLIGGEKLADRGLLSPFLGMWSANIVLGIFGIFLLVKASRKRVTINFNFILKLIPKQLKNVTN